MNLNFENNFGLEMRKALVIPFVCQDQQGHDMNTSDSPRKNREERRKLCIKRMKRIYDYGTDRPGRQGARARVIR